MLKQSEGSSSRPRSASRPALSGTLVLDLLDDAQLTTSATGGSWDMFVLTDAEFEGLGPGIVDIVLHAEGRTFSTDFRYRVRLQTRKLDGSWGDPPGGVAVYLLGGSPAIQSPVPIISTPFNDRTKLGLAIRLVLEVQNNTNANTVGACLTMSAAVRLYCGC